MIDRSLFNVEDFLVDNTFQLYCAGTDKLCVTYWENYIETHPEQQAIIAEARRLYVILSGNKKPLNLQVEVLKENIEHKNNIVPFQRKYNWLKIAAAILLLAGVSFFYFRAGNKEGVKQSMVSNFTTKAGERKKIRLKDGSVIFLNAKSSLSIIKGFNEKTREVNLVGEAFFDVRHQKDKPFKVHTEDFDINVLGTSFNVKIYPDEPTSEATLIKGLIVMEGKGSKGSSITLRPSQKVTFYKDLESPVQTNKSVKAKTQLPEITINHYTKVNDSVIAEVAWTQDRLEISDQSFAEVKGVLERWYDVQIKFTNKEVERYRFTASFPVENIEQALTALQTAEHFNYEIKGKQITISK
ncbi:FecR family protein [Pedobacter frigoris]|uniref:FecR family protein n=1 Tax=Pedobacter frigoris TaxID=2571272 RepID=UPI00292D00C8|nr:FecR domain-containing protein [Pedobacter frigoris]